MSSLLEWTADPLPRPCEALRCVGRDNAGGLVDPGIVRTELDPSGPTRELDGDVASRDHIRRPTDPPIPSRLRPPHLNPVNLRLGSLSPDMVAIFSRAVSPGTQQLTARGASGVEASRGVEGRRAESSLAEGLKKNRRRPVSQALGGTFGEADRPWRASRGGGR